MIGRSAPGQPYFAPTLLEGSAGQSLRLHITNSTPSKHNFSIPAERIDRDVGAGGSSEVVVTFPAHGVLVFYCKYHAQADNHAGELFTVPT